MGGEGGDDTVAVDLKGHWVSYPMASGCCMYFGGKMTGAYRMCNISN